MRKLILLAAVSGMVGLMPTLAGAQTPTPTPIPTPEPIQSERDYQREYGVEPGVWARQDSLVHDSVPPKPATYWATTNNANCQATCHHGVPYSLTLNYDVEGFTNFLGVTAEYHGDLVPYNLLSNPDNQTKHALMFRDESAGNDLGCGACHSQGAADTKGSNHDITGCQSCHKFSPTDVNTPHNTHIVLIQAELPLGDFANAGATSCDYCHGGLPGETGNGSCWNCHLSGHWPKAAYWQPLATGLDLPAVPELPVPALP